MRRTVGIAGSVSLHLALLALVLIHSREPESLKGGLSPEDPEASALVSILSRPVPALVPPQDGRGAMAMQCPSGTKVIFETGFIYDSESGEVVEAPEYMPAYKAGIRLGDVFLNRGVKPDTEGYMTLQFFRDGGLTVFHVKAVLICYRE